LLVLAIIIPELSDQTSFFENAANVKINCPSQVESQQTGRHQWDEPDEQKATRIEWMAYIAIETMRDHGTLIGLPGINQLTKPYEVPDICLQHTH
jgi:hypothetical protein